MITHFRQVVVSAAIAAIATSILPIESTSAQSSQVYYDYNFNHTSPIDTSSGVELGNNNWDAQDYVWVDSCCVGFRSVSKSDIQYQRRSDRSSDRNDRDRNSRDYYENLNKIYQDVLGRDIDSRGYRTYSKKLREGESLSRIRKDIVGSREAKEAINRIYQEILGRDAGSQGLRTYQKRLEDDWSLRRVRKEIANSREARERRQR